MRKTIALCPLTMEVFGGTEVFSGKVVGLLKEMIMMRNVTEIVKSCVSGSHVAKLEARTRLMHR